MRARSFLFALLLVPTVMVPAGASPVPQPPELWAVTADGATESMVASGPEGQYLSRSFEWSPNGTKLVFTKAGDIWTSNPDGTGQFNLTSTDGVEEFDPHWSPDGSEIVFVRTTGNGSDLYIAAADGSGVRTLTADEGYERNPRWSPTGEWILFQTICVDCDEDLELIRPDGSERLPLTDDDVRDLSAAWSPDGTQIAIVRGPGTTNGNELWLIDADGTDLRKRGEFDVRTEVPEWSHDGSWLAVRSFDVILIVHVATGNARAVAWADDAVASDPDWSPVALRLAFVEGANLFVHDVASTQTVPVAEVLPPPMPAEFSGASDPHWSPDGTEIVFVDNHDLTVVGADGDGLRNVVVSADRIESEPRWSPSGARIAFLRQLVPFGGGRSITLVASQGRVTYDRAFRLGGTVERTTPETSAECIAGVTVILERTVFGSETAEGVGTTTTDESGSFRFRGHADRSAAYAARVEQIGSCPLATSNPEPVKVRKKVTLSGPPISGGRVRLKADVEPCGGHRGDKVLLQKRKGGRWVTVDRDRSDDRCRAVFVQEIGGRSVFRAKAPKTDPDHLAGKSATLVIHVD